MRFGQIDQTIKPVFNLSAEVSVDKIEDSNLYLYIFFIICISLCIGVGLNDSHDSNEISKDHLRNEKIMTS
jgi:hypothetical protein